MITGSVRGTGNNVGGFLGSVESDAKVTKSFASGKVEGGNNVGGFLGTDSGINRFIEKSYSTGDVTGIDKVGGFAGDILRTGNAGYTDLYATGNVTGSNFLGGFAGASAGYVQRVYATGEVFNTTTSGGLIGSFGEMGGISAILESYWNTETSKQSSTFGGGVGLNSSAMKIQNSFTNWDFMNTWVPQADGPPLLKWQSE